jgi:AraC-like DNA-binding protein
MSAYADGDSFPSYINKIRLDEAVEMLRESPNLAISDVAEAVGFTMANFRIQFKQRYGMTPVEFREVQDGGGNV